MMKSAILTALLLVPLAARHAADAPIAKTKAKATQNTPAELPSANNLLIQYRKKPASKAG